MENASNEEQIVTEFDLFIIKIVCFENNQVNATFNDNSAIVIHPGYNYLTYFHSDNKQSNMSAEYPLKQHSIDSKMNLLLSVFNLFSNCICPYTSKYVNEYGLNCDLITSPSSIGKAYWINSDASFEENDREYFLINSHDSYTKLFLFKNLRVVKVEYPQVCPLYKEEVGEGVSHIKIFKFYSVNNLPQCWMLPLLLLVKRFKIELNLKEFHSIDLKEVNIVGNEFMTELPIQNELSGVKPGYITDIPINPLAFIYHKHLAVMFVYTRNYTYLMNNEGNVDIINNEYPYMNIYTKQRTEVLSYQEDSNENSPQSIHIDTYYKVLQEDQNHSNAYNEIVLEVINLRKYGNAKPFMGNTKQSFNDFNVERRSCLPSDFIFEGNDLHLFRELKGIGEFFSYKNKAVKANFIDRTVVKMNSNQEFVYVLNKYGRQELLRLSSINKDNEYFYYVKMLFEYYTKCFFPEKFKAQEEDKKMVNYRIEATMKSIEIADYIMFNKRKEYSDDYLYSKQPTSEDIVK